MNRFRTLVILIAVPTFALPAPAGLFDRRPKPIPAQRVPQLIAQVKTEPDERKRTAAADELHQYDPRSFPEIIPVLIDVLQSDPAAGVRLQALHSLSSFRPVSQEVGEALERAMASDKSMRVRLQARTTLVSYHWNGYHGARKTEGQPAPPQIITGAQPKLTEPPLAVDPAPSPAPSTGSAPPVIAVPVTDEARPLPMGNTAKPAAPTTPPPPPDQGPDLVPPF
jgi:HEAT repeats